MNVEISPFAVCLKAVIYLLLYNLHDCTFKINRVVSTNWAYQKERNFASHNFIFLNILFQFKNLLRVDLMEMPNRYFFVSTGVLFDGAFSL